MLTDYDIFDEVGQHFGFTNAHQLDFRDKSAALNDGVIEDRNIEDQLKDQHLSKRHLLDS